MKYVDVTVQTILFVIAFICGIDSILERNMNAGFFWTQFGVAIWQMSVSTWSMIATGSDIRRRHLELAGLYFLTLFVGFMACIGISSATKFNPVVTTTITWISMTYIFVVPWIIAIYHYVVSFKLTFNRYKKTSNFLPHINF